MSNNLPLISIISPVYKAEKIIPELVNQINHETLKITAQFEIVLVEDGSPDNSWEEIEKQCILFPHVKGIKLSRNFGQHFAITAGIENAKGEYVIVMDCDLQDNPKYISDLYQQALKGFDIVYTYKTERNHTFLKNITAHLFNKIFNYLIDNTNWKSNNNIGAYSLLSRKAVNAFISLNDYQRHYLMILRWIGFRHTYIEIQHNKRAEGKSSYSFSKLVIHAINGITSQSDKLLRLNIITGIILSIVSFLSIILIITLYLLQGFLSGWTSLVVLILFSTGMIMTSIGITGIYVGKTFEQTKNRPKFIIDKRLND
ncbi:MAG: glycosyltransferase family 2 protein [Bacteroidota bacterium]